MNADPSFFVCQRHLFLHVSASGAGAVSNFLGTQGLLCNRAFQNSTCCLSPSQLRRALREDWLENRACVESMEFAGMRHLQRFSGHVSGLCIYAVVRDPTDWLLAAINHLEDFGNDGVCALARREHPFFAWPNYQTASFEGGQRRSMQLRLFRADADPAVMVRELRQAAAPLRTQVPAPTNDLIRNYHPVKIRWPHVLERLRSCNGSTLKASTVQQLRTRYERDAAIHRYGAGGVHVRMTIVVARID